MKGLPDLPPTFSASTALHAGLHPRDLYRARDDGELIELSRGVFRQAGAPEPSWPDLLAVQHRAPEAVTCLLSAAFVHDLTDDLLPEVQIAVPRGAWRPRISYPQTEVFAWARDTFALGLSDVEAAPGEPVRVYSSARTVVDLWRFRARWGGAAAQIALRRHLRAGGDVADLLSLAGTFRVLGPVRAATDLLSAS